MKKAWALSALLMSTQVFAAPATGIFASVPVMNSGKVVTVETLLFVDQKLDKATVFSSLQQQESNTYNVACCVEVADLTPLDINAVIAKYSVDPDFADEVKGIKGYKFAYRTRYSKTDINSTQKTLISSGSSAHPIPYLMPAVEAKIMADSVKSSFKAGDSNVKLQDKTRNGADVITFTVDGKKSVFTIPAQTGG